MQDPEVPEPKSWVPTQSTVGGATVGTFLGQIIVGICDRVFKTPLDPSLAGAITGLCIFAAGYFIPDAKRS
jgi:hypothetical protein